MNRLYTIKHKGKEIFVIDYSGFKPDEMISLFDSAIQLALEKNKSLLVLSILKNNYITPTFMRYFEKELPKVNHLSKKNAIIGLSQVQHWILKGVNLWSKKPIHHFDTLDEAMDFLVAD